MGGFRVDLRGLRARRVAGLSSEARFREFEFANGGHSADDVVVSTPSWLDGRQLRWLLTMRTKLLAASSPRPDEEAESRLEGPMA
jgi:hypothetical protein